MRMSRGIFSLITCQVVTNLKKYDSMGKTWWSAWFAAPCDLCNGRCQLSVERALRKNENLAFRPGPAF